MSDQVLITSNTLQVLWTGAAQSSSRATPRTLKHKAQTHTTAVQSEHKAQTHTTTVQSEQNAPPAADQLLLDTLQMFLHHGGENMEHLSR